MAIEVRRKQNESSEALLRRFSRKVLQTGLVNRVKHAQFHIPKKNKRAVKIAALRRNFITIKKEYLQKIGKLPFDDQLNQNNRKGKVKDRLGIRVPKFK